MQIVSTMRIIILSVGLHLWPLLLFSQIDTLQTLPTVVLSENRLDIPFQESVRNVTVIGRKQIESLPVQSLPELLHYVAGVDVRQRGVHGVQADVGIRGGTFEQTLVLLNGVKLADPQTGHHLMNVPVPLEAIERIEVLKGPAARIYGQNAFAGAINIVTKVPESSTLQAAFNAGRHQTFGGSLNASFTGNHLRQLFSISKKHSQGYRHNSDYDIANWFYQNAFALGNAQASAMLGHTERAFGANGFYASPQYTEQYEEVKTTFASLQFAHRGKNLTSKYRINWRRNHDEYIFVRENPSLYHNRHTSHTLSTETHFSLENKLGTSGFGIELTHMWLKSNNLGDHERSSATVFLEHRLELLDGRFDLTPGVAMAYYPEYGTRLFPGIDAGYNLSAHLKWLANVGYTWRIPTFTDLYYEDPANEGNPNLKPEKALTWETGPRYQLNGFNLQAAAFLRQGRDLIDWVRPADTLRWKPVNYQQLDTRGIDLSASIFFPLLTPSMAPLELLQLNYSWLDADLNDPGEGLSRYTLEHLRHQISATLIYQPMKNLRHTFHVRRTDRISLPAYTVVDTRLVWQTNCMEFFASVNNLFDVEYKESNLVPMPGRWWMVGIKWRNRGAESQHD